MKHTLILGTLLIAANANADVLGLTAEVGSYSPDADLWAADTNTTGTSDMDADSGIYYGIALEHPIPVIPNLRIQGTEITADGTATATYNGSSYSNAAASIDLSHTDFTLYYELLDGLFWLNLDLGITLRQYDGYVEISNDRTDLSETLPMLYASPFIDIPGTGLSIGGEIKYLSYDDSSITDTSIKVKWESPFLVGIEAGYRQHEIDLVDVSDLDVYSDNSGVFIGINIDI
ncbi:hypothetical protein TW85_09755 [Marinomonas sp. S3726]|uniref:TIGR04219 family outer membrane beta-barrel protein n=1 Tax=Marinomonas sp. S3726 TaxID=579484 RepID=UPI0005F9D47A|nr:TIGR04219 family outer membrane beta-barrel protein [Marinomonas sp. S3726]KJZ14197.1 hypothetical protein TW85_09755 [Marinomonas sp. S3726]